MRKILVIEDDINIRSNLVEVLELEGFHTFNAHHGQEGIRLAKAYLPDLILCDVMMPGIDGYGVLEALRTFPETRTIPVIFLTAKSTREDIRRGMNLGAADYLTKPCSVSDLLDAIASRLTQRDAIAAAYTHDAHLMAAKTALLDPLTQLPTRSLLCQRLQHWLTSASLHDATHSNIAVFALNIHRFRTINASFGHNNGDRLLKLVAQRLVDLVASTGFVARLNGDEFAIVLTNPSSLDAVTTFAEQVLDTTVKQPYDLDHHPIYIQATLGITYHPCTSMLRSAELLTQAETAQNWCQQHGQLGYRLYIPQMDEHEVERRLIEMDLPSAIAQSEFQVYYQPQVHLKTGQIVGLEALLRWHHPRRGAVSPATFIPIAEEVGLIVPLGAWVLRTACEQAKRWQNTSATPIRMSVNISMRQLQQPDFLNCVATILQETELPPHLLILELTESCLMEDVTSTIKILRSLKQLGIEISIDDFGTGYSSLNYLNCLPIDALKIDQSFVRQVTTSDRANAIPTAIITMAQSLKLKVVAEGVETQKQLQFLRDRGCQLMQGYLYSPAVSAAEIEAFLQADRRLQLASA